MKGRLRCRLPVIMLESEERRSDLIGPVVLQLLGHPMQLCDPGNDWQGPRGRD